MTLTMRSASLCALIAASAILFAFAGSAHAQTYGSYDGPSYTASTWGWNAMGGPNTGLCDGGWDLDDSNCMFSPDYQGYGGGGYQPIYMPYYRRSYSWGSWNTYGDWGMNSGWGSWY